MESNIVYSLEPKFQRLKNESMENVRSFLKARYEDRVKKGGMYMTWDKHSADIIDEVAAWLGTPYKTGLLLFGGYGTGKTTVLSCIEDIFRKDYFDPGHVRRYYPFEIIDILKSNQLPAPMAEFVKAPVMLIDEVGMEPLSSTIWGERCSPVRDIIIARYDHSKTTIIATNLDSVEFRSHYGDRVMDRLTQAYTCIYLGTDSYRHDPEGK